MTEVLEFLAQIDLNRLAIGVAIIALFGIATLAVVEGSRMAKDEDYDPKFF